MAEEKSSSEDLEAETGAGESPDLDKEGALNTEETAAADEIPAEVGTPDPVSEEKGEEESVPFEEKVISEPPSEAAAGPDEPAVVESGDEKGPERPSLAKRIAGIVAIIFGALGVILSIAAIVAVWVVNKPITDSSVQLLVTVEDALGVVEEGLARADETLQTVRDSIADAAAQIPTAELLAVIDNIGSIVDSAQSTADTASSVIGVANSIPFLGSSRSEEESSGEKLDEISSTLEQISIGLTTVTERLEGLSEGGAPGGVIDNIDQELEGFQSRLNEAENNVNETGTAVAEVTANVPRWIDIASIIISLLIIWLGVAQYSLLAHGVSWFRGV